MCFSGNAANIGGFESSSGEEIDPAEHEAPRGQRSVRARRHRHGGGREALLGAPEGAAAPIPATPRKGSAIEGGRKYSWEQNPCKYIDNFVVIR